MHQLNTFLSLCQYRSGALNIYRPEISIFLRPQEPVVKRRHARMPVFTIAQTIPDIA